MILAALFAAETAAQEGGGLEARLGGSHARPPAGAEGDATSYLGGGLLAWTPLGAGEGTLWISADAAEAVDGAGGSWGSLAAGADRRWPLGAGLAFGLEATGRAFSVGGETPYRALAAEAAPRLAWSGAGVEVYVEGRAGAGRSWIEAAGESAGPGSLPGPPGSGGAPEVEETVTDLWRWGGDAGLRVPLEDVEMEVRAGGWDAAIGVHRRASVSLRGGGAGSVSWRAEGGVWDTPVGGEVVGALTLRVPVGGGWSVRASGGRAEPDPLLGSRPGVYGGMSVHRNLVRFEGDEAPALARVRTDDDRPRARFTLEAPGAEHVVLLGDFTGWEPVAMEPAGAGRWRVELPVRPGVHHFGFRVDGRWHVPEEAAGRVRDEWGRVNATLVVPG